MPCFDGGAVERVSALGEVWPSGSLIGSAQALKSGECSGRAGTGRESFWVLSTLACEAVSGREEHAGKLGGVMGIQKIPSLNWSLKECLSHMDSIWRNIQPGLPDL